MDGIYSGVEVIEGADAETRGGPELVFGEGLSKDQGWRVDGGGGGGGGGTEVRGGDWTLEARREGKREMVPVFVESEGVWVWDWW